MADGRILPRTWWSHTAIALALFVALTLANAWPLAVAPNTTVGQHGDAFFSVWRLAWVAHQLRANPLHLFDGNIFYPEPRTLAYSDAMLLPAVVLAPFHWAGARPLVVYNVFLLSTFVLNGLAAYVLIYRLAGSFMAALSPVIILRSRRSLRALRSPGDATVVLDPARRARVAPGSRATDHARLSDRRRDGRGAGPQLHLLRGIPDHLARRDDPCGSGARR